MRLSTRLMVAMVVLVLLTASAIGLLTYRNVAALALPRAFERIDTHALVVATVLESSLRGARADVVGFRSAVALAGIISARNAGGVHPVDGITESQWRARLASRFAAELAAKPTYSQFRVIGLADAGREIVRVDRSGPNGAIRVVLDAELQRRGDRDYFAAAMQLPDGQVYVSPVDLNKEFGIIQTPYVPTLRAATPVFAADGEPFGLVIINVDLRTAFASVRSAAQGANRIFLVNERGDYLVHPERDREFGFDIGKTFRVQDELPDIAEFLARGEMTARVIHDRSGARFGIGLKSVRLAGGPQVIVIESIPYSQLMAPANAVRDATVFGGFAAVFGALFLAVGLARSLSRPLVEMTRAVQGFARDQSLALPRGGGHEVNVLGKAFERMRAEVREKAGALQHEIEQRSRIFESSLDLILITDRRGQFFQVSPSCESILGYRPDEMMGHLSG